MTIDERERGARPGEANAAAPEPRISAPPDGTVRALLERARTTPSIRPVGAGSLDLRAAISAQRRSAPAPPSGLAAAGATVERVTVEVKIGARTEMVALGLDGGRLLVAASDGAGESSPFAHAALAWLDARADALDLDVPRTPSLPAAATADARTSSDDLLVALARGGVRVGASPAVLEALGRIGKEPRGAVPLVRSRWLARIRAALGTADGDLVARLVIGGAPAASSAPEETVLDRSFVELAREPVAGDAGTTIERRHLCDTARGEIVLEERVLGEPGASLGPCPRLCAVGYGELHAGIPRRIVVSQYAIVPEVPTEHWDRVLGCAVPLAAAQRSALEALAQRGDAEPVAIVLGAVAEDGGLSDDAGTRYAFAQGVIAEPAAAALLALAGKEPVRWVLCRFDVAQRAVGIIPLACAWRDGERWRHARLR